MHWNYILAAIVWVIGTLFAIIYALDISDVYGPALGNQKEREPQERHDRLTFWCVEIGTVVLAYLIAGAPWLPIH
jgi:hypothetical protein